MKIFIMGAGAIGGLFGSNLAKADHQIIFYDNNLSKIALMEKEGLFWHDKQSEKFFCSKNYANISFAKNMAEMHSCDLVLLAVKNYQVPKLLADLLKYINPQSLLLTIQNGLGYADALKKSSLCEQLLLGLTYQGAFAEKSNLIRHMGEGLTYMAPCTLDNLAKAQNLAAIFNQAAIECRAISTNEIIKFQWQKLLVNSVINPLTALNGYSNGALLDDEKALAQAKNILQEGILVAKANNINFDYQTIKKSIIKTCQNTASNKSSMLMDVENNRATEIKFINGTIVREGAKYNILTPENEKIIMQIKNLEKA